ATTCNGHGTCSAAGSCNCAGGYTGPNCGACAPDHYGYPACVFCQGQTTCSGHGQCSSSGNCICDVGYSGASCLACNGVTVEAVCSDGVDDDCDLTTDCADTDCCTAGACAAGDHDGDTFAGCDCDDSNPQAWATPGEVRDLVFTSSGTKLVWSAPLAPGGNPLVYTTLRFDDPRDFDGVGFCVAMANPNNLSSTDFDTPAPGRAFFYLIRATSACPNGAGPLGASSSGDPRTGTCH
ncbi:MAG TPA: hypothetical protein VFQ07_15450, partial [Candidatus Polarisedimenticolia bacterium]|nr:hypothetical protein [Candidatus Polarisedimenticolia bacterium]